MTLKITEIENGTHGKHLRLEGKIADGDASVLERALGRLGGEESITVDLSGVSFIDAEGLSIVNRFKREGVNLIGADFFIRTVIEAQSDQQNESPE